MFPEVGLHDGVGHAGGAGGLVIVRDLDLFSYCESCLLPFQIKCHVGYVPSGQRVLGLSKLSRVADIFAKRLQDPQRLAVEVCSALHDGSLYRGLSLCSMLTPTCIQPHVTKLLHTLLLQKAYDCPRRTNHASFTPMLATPCNTPPLVYKKEFDNTYRGGRYFGEERGTWREKGWR